MREGYLGHPNMERLTSFNGISRVRFEGLKRVLKVHNARSRGILKPSSRRSSPKLPNSFLICLRHFREQLGRERYVPLAAMLPTRGRMIPYTKIILHGSGNRARSHRRSNGSSVREHPRGPLTGSAVHSRTTWGNFHGRCVCFFPRR